MTGERTRVDAPSRRGLPFRPYKDHSGLLAALKAANADARDDAPVLPRRAMAASGAPYAGDVSPTYAYEILKAERDALLVDVRTRAEWAFVGVPDLSAIDKQAAFIEWKHYPDMRTNEAFLTELDRASGNKTDAAVFFLCRSGARSQAAAMAATEAGYTRAYNIEDGFEGPLNTSRHRGTSGGWKAEGLPWGQT